MAGSSLLALLDDIATNLDDIAAMTKIAAKKTSGVLGDDLALNAEQVSGIAAHRELPVVWAVAKGSFVNKLILIPAALAISQFVPWLITPLLMLGGAYLCFEGFEKVYEKFFHKHDPATVEVAETGHTSLEELEKEKIKGAVKTDFVLSAEIIVITMGTVATEGLARQAAVLSGIGLLMTVGVYGLVGLIVKLDDIGLYLVTKKRSEILVSVGKGLIKSVPYLMKFLGIAGTIAMFLVGGGIITHGIPPLAHIEHDAHFLVGMGINLSVGLTVGALAVLIVNVFNKIRSKKS